MALITTTQAKALWPTWQTFMDNITVQGQTSEQLLQTAIDLAIAEWGNYLATEDDDMTDTLRMQLMHLVKKHAWDMKFGGQSFDAKKETVQWLKDYEATTKKLEEGLISDETINITSKDKHFDQGFVDTGEIWYEQ